MRVLLFTGKGGVGKTTVAAATAVRAARAGHRTLVMSTDPAHSLADSFDLSVGSEATRLEPNLWAEQIDAQERLEANWREIQEYVVALMSWEGIDSLQAEELSVLPGFDEIFALIDVKRHVERASYDLLVVDCAPTAETLRLLSLPEILNWYVERIFPVGRRVVKTIRPLVARMTSMPIAGDQVFGAVERLHRNLDGVRRILTDEEVSSVRLVVNPERMVIAEARRTYTYLGLFGYRVDSVIVNRIIPEDVTDPYFGKWKDIQAEHLATVRESFEPVPILTGRLFDREMVGIELLRELADEVYGDRDVVQVLYRDEPIRIRKRGAGYALRIRLPFVSRDQMDIHRRGEELYVKVGSYKRSLILPVTLQRLQIREASFVGDHLEIVFGDASEVASAASGSASGGGPHG